MKINIFRDKSKYWVLKMFKEIISKAYSQSLLDIEEEMRLIRAARLGSRDAKDALIMAHIRIAYAAAVDLKGYGFSIEDLFQQGVIGLHMALDKFDSKVGVRFGRYAKTWVRGAMTRFIVENWSLLKVETRLYRKMFFSLRRSQLELSGFGVDVSALEPNLSAAQRAELETIAPIIAGGERSLDAPVNAEAEGSMTLLDVLADEGEGQDIIEAMTRSELMQLVREAMQTLSDTQQRILLERYMGDEERSLADIGKAMDMSSDRVRRAEKSALEQIRQHLRKRHDIEDLSDLA